MTLFAYIQAWSAFGRYSFQLLRGMGFLHSSEEGCNRTNMDPSNYQMRRKHIARKHTIHEIRPRPMELAYGAPWRSTLRPGEPFAHGSPKAPVGKCRPPPKRSHPGGPVGAMQQTRNASFQWCLAEGQANVIAKEQEGELQTCICIFRLRMVALKICAGPAEGASSNYQSATAKLQMDSPPPPPRLLHVASAGAFPCLPDLRGGNRTPHRPDGTALVLYRPRTCVMGRNLCASSGGLSWVLRSYPSLHFGPRRPK